MAQDVPTDEVLRFAAYLQSDCNKLLGASSLDMQGGRGDPGPRRMAVTVGNMVYVPEDAPAGAECPYVLRYGGMIVN